MNDSREDTPFVAPDARQLNELFPAYEIEGLIASGGMGAVYCALQKSLDRTVALKILPKELSKDAAFCSSFQAEAKAMARLNHPNLIGVYDFGEVDDMLFIIMEFVPGQSIYHSANGQAIDPREVARLVTRICEGLSHAHENGIIHRDIKPSNILLDFNIQPKIGDFGLARPVERKIQEGEEIFGTPHYTAPEVVNAPQTVDHRADIFSVGVLLHELLTGKLPADDPRLPSLISKCDPRFDRIVKKATSPDPKARYGSAKEIVEALSAITTSKEAQLARPVVAGPRPEVSRVPVGKRPKPIVDTKKSSGSSFAFILALAAVGGGLYYYHKNHGLPFLESPKTVEPVVVSDATEPEPAPEPTPEIEPPSEPTTSPEKLAAAPVPEPAKPTEPAPTIETPQAPKMDMSAFYQRVRKIMQDRAKSEISQYQFALTNNFRGFETDIKHSLSDLGIRAVKEKKALDDSLLELRESGNRLPQDLAKKFSEFPGIEEHAPNYLDKQTNIDAAFKKSMTSHASTYIVGLQKQIERSQAESDAGAIKLLEAEIKLTRDDVEYFPNLMLGIDPKANLSANEPDEEGYIIPHNSKKGLVLPTDE